MVRPCTTSARGWDAVFLIAAIFVAAAFFSCPVAAEDWPSLGRDATRNPVSPEKNPPTDWQIERRDKQQSVVVPGRNIRWSAPLGPQSFGTPVVAQGLVWVGAMQYIPTAINQKEPASVLKCFRESDGRPLYDYVSPRLPSWINDSAWTGLGCSPLVEQDRLWFTTNRCEVVCLDIGPLIQGAGRPHLIWKLDMMNTLGVFPRAHLMGPPRTCSIGASYQGRIYVVTGNGVAENYRDIPAPEAPSLLCLDKHTGEVLWSDHSPGQNILVTQLASPLVMEIDGRGQVIVPQGDGWLRSFAALTGELLWEFDMNFKVARGTMDGRGTRNQILATPVFHEGYVYLASGQDLERGEVRGRLVCIDPRRSGDVSSELAVDANGKALPHRRERAVDPEAGEKAIANSNSALVWEFVRSGEKFEDFMHGALGSVAIAGGLLMAADGAGMVHCLDAKTGARHWAYDAFATVVSSPLIVDGKVYVADEDGDIAVFQLDADPRSAQPIAEILMENRVNSSPVFANGVLYVASQNTLFAIAGTDTPSTIAELPATSHPVEGGRRERTLRSAFVPTPQSVVEKMLELAAVKETDVVYDLGSGDGRIVIEAAKKHGCRAIGYEIDQELVESSRVNATTAGVENLVTFHLQDLFTADLRDADVIAVYLLPKQLEKLLPQLETLKPGARIVSHHFKFPDVEPGLAITVETEGGAEKHEVFLWTAPLKKAQPDVPKK